ncbi:alpha/beta hydrolase [Marinobacter confluentis]|uniref:Alpha/beta hydrolase n=2 Tax=Marinobacter confluentis TaxID=1697557 RepID=A0A4Z1C729_9GAMM|nr:alpha/beta hydrolase [Marinobacter confluentis]
MESMAISLALGGVATVRFEFPYMEKRRADGRKRPPDRQPVLLARYRQIIQQLGAQERGELWIGGKSMGGRIASILAADPELSGTVDGCVCFGYPFHPPGRPDRWRVEHFDRFHCPVLIVQGTRDPFGKKGEVQACDSVSASTCRINWLEGGNHDFQPLASQRETPEQMIDSAARAAAAFILENG